MSQPYSMAEDEIVQMLDAFVINQPDQDQDQTRSPVQANRQDGAANTAMQGVEGGLSLQGLGFEYLTRRDNRQTGQEVQQPDNRQRQVRPEDQVWPPPFVPSDHQANPWKIPIEKDRYFNYGRPRVETSMNTANASPFAASPFAASVRPPQQPWNNDFGVPQPAAPGQGTPFSAPRNWQEPVPPVSLRDQLRPQAGMQYAQRNQQQQQQQREQQHHYRQLQPQSGMRYTQRYQQPQLQQREHYSQQQQREHYSQQQQREHLPQQQQREHLPQQQQREHYSQQQQREHYPQQQREQNIQQQWHNHHRYQQPQQYVHQQQSQYQQQRATHHRYQQQQHQQQQHQQQLFTGQSSAASDAVATGARADFATRANTGAGHGQEVPNIGADQSQESLITDANQSQESLNTGAGQGQEGSNADGNGGQQNTNRRRRRGKRAEKARLRAERNERESAARVAVVEKMIRDGVLRWNI